MMIGKLLIPITLAGAMLAWPRRVGEWSPPKAADQYIVHIRAAEQQHGLPHNLLARLLQQESAYRADIITGKTISSAGAVGIAQIIPKWHPGVNPLDANASIYYAAKYLQQLYVQFGDWRHAIMAYNWGPGNVAAWKRGEKSIPDETRSYINAITRDVAIA